MNSEEYYKLFNVEKNHWFYKGKRDIARKWIKRLTSFHDKLFCLDVGAGTGIFVKEISSECQAVGVEPSQEGVTLAAKSNQLTRFVSGSALELPFPDESADIVTSFDVLEHIEDDQRAFQEIVRVTKKGGLMVLTVPAYKFLMGDWDKALGHYRRYQRGDFQRLLQGQSVEIIKLRYINNFLFLPIVVYRFLRDKLPSSKFARLEDSVPNKAVNWLCYHTFVAPAMMNWPDIPFGLSLLCIARRTN